MKKQSSSILGFIVVLFIVIACGKYESSNKRTTETSSRSLFSANATATYTPVPTSTVTAATATKTSADLKSSKAASKTATVISENANLRKTANQSSPVVAEVSEGIEVEVIKQKSAWFLVRANGQEGWLHGNTIRLADQSESSIPSQSATYSKPPTSYSTPMKTINNSGASAKCRDGSLSYSAHRRGTCSHHGGVAEWY